MQPHSSGRSTTGLPRGLRPPISERQRRYSVIYRSSGKGGRSVRRPAGTLSVLGVYGGVVDKSTRRADEQGADAQDRPDPRELDRRPRRSDVIISALPE